MEDISIQNNVVTGYSVSGINKRIVIRTEQRGKDKPFELIDVVFEGVEGYQFKDNLSGIIFDIYESNLDFIFKEFDAVISDGTRYGWLGQWNEDTQKAMEYLRKNYIKPWLVQSSFGFDGFVLAKNMRKLRV